MWIPKNLKGNVVLIVEKEGYSSIIKSFPAGGIFQTNTVLYPIENTTWKNGKGEVENIPENVSKGEMAVFNPVKESDMFPGNFFESEGKMLVSDRIWWDKALQRKRKKRLKREKTHRFDGKSFNWRDCKIRGLCCRKWDKIIILKIEYALPF